MATVINHKQDFCPRLMVRQRLISIIDKEKFFGTGNGPIPGNRMESLTKVGLYDFHMNQEVRVKR